MADPFRPLEAETSPPAELLGECRAFISTARWTFARSMPQWPHEYALRHRVRAQGIEKEFDRFAQWLDDWGYEGRFGSAVRMYLNVDGWRYWKMEPVGQPPISVINRAKIIEPAQLRLDAEGER